MTAGAISPGAGARAWAPETVTDEPYNAQTPTAALAEPVTPAGALFVRDHFGIPRATPRTWRLRLEGAVAAPFSLGHRELAALPHRELDVVVECAGNGRSLMTPRPPGVPWTQRAVGCAHFAGVPFHVLASRARIDPAAVEIVFAGADSGSVHGRTVAFERSLPLDAALHPDTLLATHMNGEPLAPEHGAPVRLVVPGRYAVADVKWLVEARAVTRPFTGVFQADDYVYVASRGTPDGPVTTLRVKSLITEPEADSALRRGRGILVRGRAWSGAGRAVRRVDVRAELLEAGTTAGAAPWLRAELDRPSGAYAWTGWSCRWTPERPGPYRLIARATDDSGESQPLRAPWNAHGYGCNQVASVEVVVV
ncbi:MULTISPECIES: molybdopterin-dependent oxidoreductase [Streptomyces]|uniref:Molybdopterin-dependent oxidoreductase n=1 Tax=Streptomyces solicathayae TaxID=3081768 RepID=A0ABZ0LNM2_9ACTN|nr:molybdopterin-dependent oxidoreductase [Streptomyces sp. HUAS YS2]WOX20820.1 molybdopterin-dependent oxidoreductase [Streptomyces sp. HUAS YS2]